MEQFLKTVARHYLAKVESQAQINGEPDTLPFSRYLFCFPNHRSSLFFSRYLQEVYSEDVAVPSADTVPCVLPAMTTINELFGQFSSCKVIDRTALLFRLYRVYARCCRELNQREPETFDQFVFWGDMLLSDFDDVDRYLVDADKLFANVRDLKEIDVRFSGLTPEQIEVIRSFWKHYNPEINYPEGEKHEVFGQTWSILAPLYHSFREQLAARDEAYAGMMERKVVEWLRGQEVSDPFAGILAYDKVVFVGLTAISEVERRLMALLKLHGHADFCWDYADPRLHPVGSKATSAAYFSKANLSDFANELSDTELQRGLVPEQERHYSLFSVASGVGQARQANLILRYWQQHIPDFDPFRTAVVLPDEALLLPMLYAVPSQMQNFNVTMGYSLRNTPIAAFVSKLFELQRSFRPETGTFYFRPVLPLLSHSFTVTMSGEKAKQLESDIVGANLFQVPVSKFEGDAFLASVFRPVRSAKEAIAYLKDILTQLMTHTLADVDYEFIYHYHKTLSSLAVEVDLSELDFTPQTLFRLLEKLVAGVSVPFQGEPLNGLQVMGVLETRALDFDNVIILSMNEGTFPAKPSQNTFVPLSLRDAFGMPTQRHRDAIFAYHFYRLIGRASRVALVYDSRTDGQHSGEESRYIKQLRYLMGHDELQPTTLSDTIGTHVPTPIIVQKTPDVMALLERCLGEQGSVNLSASALKDYIKCPLKFYLSYIRRLRDDDEVTETVDSKLFGDILHSAICELYSHCQGRQVEASMLKRYLQEPYVEITRAVHKAFRTQCKVQQLDGYNLLVSGLIVQYIVDTLRHDITCCPFVYLAGEQRDTFLYDAGHGLKVRITCVYDRLDQPLADNGAVRIVDYKTGNSVKQSKLKFSDVHDFFTPQGKGSSEAFQVMMYSLLLEHASPQFLDRVHLPAAPGHVVPHLYFVRDFSSHDKVSTHLRCKNDEVLDFSPYRDAFGKELSALLTDIFNPDLPFTQCEETKPCEYCAFANLCNR